MYMYVPLLIPISSSILIFSYSSGKQSVKKIGKVSDNMQAHVITTTNEKPLSAKKTLSVHRVRVYLLTHQHMYRVYATN